MTKTIEQILKEQGPLLSGELITQMQLQEPGINNDAIRKRMSRTGPNVRKYYGHYADKQKLFYLQEHFEAGEFNDALLNSFEKKGKRLDSIIKALEYHGGYLHEDQIAAYCFSPVDKLVGHKQFFAIIAELERLKLVYKEDGYYRLSGLRSQKEFSSHKAVEIAKRLTLSHFMNWARDIGLVSYNKGTFFSIFAKLKWGFTAPSYIGGLTTIQDNKKIPVFVVADIMLATKVSSLDVDFFLRKLEICKAQKKVPKTLPFLLFEDASADAFTKLKAAGIIVGNLTKLFGSEYSKILAELVVTVINAGAILKANPEQYFEFVEKINKLVDGKVHNLRGDLFEMAVGYYYSRSCNNLDIGKLIRSEGQTREADVFAVYDTEIIVAECKGYKSPATLEEIEKWYTHKIPVIRQSVSDQDAYESKQLIFEFWSTGGFTPDAMKKLAHLSKARKYQIRYYDEVAIMKKAGEIKSPKFLHIMRQYFIHEDI